MRREQAWPYVSYCVDDAMAERTIHDIPENPQRARLIGWNCGFEPLFVAVWSYLEDIKLDDDEAIELATDLLIDKKWFVDKPTPPDYIL